MWRNTCEDHALRKEDAHNGRQTHAASFLDPFVQNTSTMFLNHTMLHVDASGSNARPRRPAMPRLHQRHVVPSTLHAMLYCSFLSCDDVMCCALLCCALLYCAAGMLAYFYFPRCELSSHVPSTVATPCHGTFSALDSIVGASDVNVRVSTLGSETQSCGCFSYSFVMQRNASRT